jgi:hypothetical protein
VIPDLVDQNNIWTALIHNMQLFLLQNGQNGSDSNLQLAMALSASLREAEEREMLQEVNCLLEAGLGHEVVEQQKQILERFGFRSSRPAILAPSSSRHRSGRLILSSTLLEFR